MIPMEVCVKMLRVCLVTCCYVILSLATLIAAFGQESSKPDTTIDAAVRSEVIEGVIKQLNEQYVFPDTAREIDKAIRERSKKGEYDQVTSAAELAKRLT